MAGTRQGKVAQQYVDTMCTTRIVSLLKQKKNSCCAIKRKLVLAQNRAGVERESQTYHNLLCYHCTTRTLQCDERKARMHRRHIFCYIINA